MKMDTKVREVSQQVKCRVGTVHTVIHESLNMRRLCTRWIPKMLSEHQKAQRVDDIGPGVTTKHNHNRCFIMLEVICIKFSLELQNSLGTIMCKF